MCSIQLSAGFINQLYLSVPFNLKKKKKSSAKLNLTHPKFILPYSMVTPTCRRNVAILQKIPRRTKWLHQFMEGKKQTATKHNTVRTQQTESMYSLHMETMTWLFTHWFNDIHFLLMALLKMWMPDVEPTLQQRWTLKGL